MGAPAGLPEQTHHAHGVWSQGQCSPSWDYLPRHLQVRVEWRIYTKWLFWKIIIFIWYIWRASSKYTSHLLNNMMDKLQLPYCPICTVIVSIFTNISLHLPSVHFPLLPVFPQTLLSSGTTVRSWWATGVVGSLAGQSATSRAVQLLITGWRTRWLTAAPAALFASPSPSDATTAGTAGSSSARSKKITSFQLWLPLIFAYVLRPLSIKSHSHIPNKGDYLIL